MTENCSTDLGKWMDDQKISLKKMSSLLGVARQTVWKINRGFPCSPDNSLKIFYLTGGQVKIPTKKRGRPLKYQTIGTSMTTHNKYKSREYTVWLRLKTLCYNKNSKGYFTYGGRGIKMDTAWVKDFTCFLKDVGTCPETCTGIELIDLNRDFCKENARWVSKETRRSLKDMPNIKGKTRKKIYQNPKKILLTIEEELFEVIRKQASRKSLEKKVTISPIQLIREILEQTFPNAKQLSFNDI